MKYVILVHPTLSVDFTFKILKSKGYKIFTIVTDIERGQIDTAFLKKHSDVYFHGSASPEDDLPRIKEIIEQQGLDVFIILNGIDSAIYYTDYLRKYVLGRDIDLKYSKIRLNKYAVNEVLEKAGIKTIPSLEVVSVDELHQKKEAILSMSSWPLVAKPSENTAAMAGFAVVYCWDELLVHVTQLLGSSNAYYETKDVSKVIIQKFIDPRIYQEFVVDFVSFGSQHVNTGLLLYKKTIINDELVYRFSEPCAPDETPDANELIDYVKQILEALHVTYSATHNEVFWDQEKNDYYLIESNNRMAGRINELYQKTYGISSLETLLLLAEGKPIPALPKQLLTYCVGMDLYNLTTDAPTKIADLTNLSSLKKQIHFRGKGKPKLASFAHYSRASHIAASFILENKDRAQLEADIQTILDLEEKGTLFQK